MICLCCIKAPLVSSKIKGRTNLSLLAIVMVIILNKMLHKLIDLKSLGWEGFLHMGIKTILVLFKLVGSTSLLKILKCIW